MAYFLCITDFQNWPIINSKKIWGVSKKHSNKIAKMNKGDYLVIYESAIPKTVGFEGKPPQIKGIYKVKSEVVENNRRIFESPKKDPNEVYPLRVSLENVKIFDEPVNFRNLIEKLDFIRNKQRWSLHLVGKPIIQLSEKDYNTLISN
jgi:predicted RNA-binding protein